VLSGKHVAIKAANNLHPIDKATRRSSQPSFPTSESGPRA
jgi:hypothetical protein